MPRQPQHTGTPEKRAAFLQALSETCNVKRSCELANVPRRTVYNWRAEDPAFADQFDEAKSMGGDALEDEAVRRASEGIDEQVFYQGECVGTVKRYSDTLLIFLLKGAKPELYKDRVAAEVSGPGGQQLSDTDRAVRIASIFAEIEKRNTDNFAGE